MKSVFPTSEHFPKRMVVQFSSYEKTVIVTVNGLPLDRPLSDLSYEEDFYRYHDVFHVAFATYLSWSPCLKKLMNIKRVNGDLASRVEDGARARIVEEAISLIIFNFAKKHDWFKGVRKIPKPLLKSIGELTEGREVHQVDTIVWEACLLKAFEIWRLLREDREGTIIADLSQRTMQYEKVVPTAKAG
jgi:hypothetical protein